MIKVLLLWIDNNFLLLSLMINILNWHTEGNCFMLHARKFILKKASIGSFSQSKHEFLC
jgi:hypothetical protein